MVKKGLFIAFEGIDGSGKSTQAKMLADYIISLNKYNHVLRTREPYQDQNIRKILQQEEDPYSQGIKLAMMFTEDRRNHVNKLIMPNLLEGVHVISDRYSWSTFAYQQTQGVKLHELLNMHKELPIPDIVFLVDLPVKDAIKRMKGDKERKLEQKFEKDIEFIEKLRNNYLKLSNTSQKLVIVVNGKLSAKEIFNKQIKPIFDTIYNARDNNLKIDYGLFRKIDITKLK